MLDAVAGKFNLRSANNILFALIVCINVYIISAPLTPQFIYWWNIHHTHRQEQLEGAINHPSTIKTPAGIQVPGPNRLIAPAMMLDQATLEGPVNNWFNILYKGIWRWPNSSTPDRGGNTVFLSHRFSYTGPRGAFYYLNKLQPGDNIGVIWNGKLYTYSVVSSETVPPTDTTIEDNTPDARITLFTCTPLWHPIDRLVVIAKLKSVT